MSEGDIAKTAKKPEEKAAATSDASQDSARSRLTAEAGLADPKRTSGDGDKKVSASDAVKEAGDDQKQSPFADVLKDTYGARALALAKKGAQDAGGGDDLVFTPLAGFDAQGRDGAGDRLHKAGYRPNDKASDGPTELAHGDRSKLVKEKDGSITDQGDVNGTHYDITASKDKDSIVWKDKDGKEHRFERKKGENQNEYTDGDGTKLVQNGDKNTITYKNGFQVEIDARTGRTIIQHDQREIAQYNGKDAVRRQLDDNNVAFQVRGDVTSTIDQIKDYQKRTGQPQNGNMIIKNEKGDTVVLQQDGTEITRKADSTTVSIKRGDTVVEYTPGQDPKIISGGDHVTRNNNGLQIDGKEMLTKDGEIAISGLKDGRLDSRFGRIYGVTDKGGQVDLGTGRAIADSLTTTNTGTGVEATTSDGTTILKTGPNSKQIQSGPVTTNVDQDHPTTTIKGSDGSNININNVDGSSRITDSDGNDIANINGNGDMCTWDGTFLGADGNIFNADMDFSGFTSYTADGPSSFSSSSSRAELEEERNEVSAAVMSNSTSAVGMADSVCATATSLANNLDASAGTLGQIDSGIGTLGATAAELERLLPFNPNLADQLALVNQSWARLDGIRSVVQNQVAAQDTLNRQYGVTSKSVVASAVELGGTPQAVDQAAQYYQLQQTA